MQNPQLLERIIELEGELELKEHEERIADCEGVLRDLEELEDKVKEQEERIASLEWAVEELKHS